MQCPYCEHSDIVKNGSNRVGTANYRCKGCLRQFVENPKNKRISAQEKQLVDQLLLEKLPLAGIARVVGVSAPWLQNYVNKKYETQPRTAKVSVKTTLNLTIECDEMWSFVSKKKAKYWIWLAIDRNTREIIGVHIGDRSREGAQALWDSIPNFYRQNAQPAIPTFGRRIRVFFQKTVIRLWVKKQAKPIISNALTAPSDNACLDWLEKHFRFPKNLKIISVRFGILFITIMTIFVTN